MYLKTYKPNLVQNGPVVSEKSQFQFSNVNDMGQGREMTLTSNTHIPSLISCLLVPSFRSQAAILSEKSTVFTFSYRKAYVTKFDLGVNKVKVNPGSSFVQTMMGWSPQCYIPSFVEFGAPVLEKKIFKRFYHEDF